MSLEFTTTDGQHIELTEYRCIVAGYTGRDRAAVQHHIDELAAIGVPPPPSVPMFYEMHPPLVSTEPELTQRGHSLTSGEVEPVYVRHKGTYYLGVGSDHTDRELEREDIAESKLACGKPLGATIIRIGSHDDLATFSLDDATARSLVDGALYQHGLLRALRTPADIIQQLEAQLALPASTDIVCYGGTLPLIDGSFRAGTRWELEISLPNGTRLTHEYRMKGTDV